MAVKILLEAKLIFVVFLSRLCGGEVCAILAGRTVLFLSRLCGGEVKQTVKYHLPHGGFTVLNPTKQ